MKQTLNTGTMRITKKGKYRLLRDYIDRGTISIGTLPKGVILNVTQISEDYHQIIAKELSDWNYWEMPVEAVI